jgi:hypothetical protein
VIPWLLSFALAGTEERPVHPGDTVESLAGGNPVIADTIRTLNGFGPAEEPVVGTLVTVPADPVGTQEAFLISLSGKATVRPPGAPEPSPVGTFEPIPAGAELCTLDRSRATVRLASTCNRDGSASDDIAMLDATCVVVTTANSSTEGRASVVRVNTGSIAVLAQEDARGHVTVVTPSGITSGPAGGFRVTLEEGASRTETVEGTATVAGAGAEVSLKEGQGSRVVTGEAPSTPVDLLRPGALIAPADPSVLLRPAFRWDAVEGALGYRFEIGGSVDFREVLYREDTPETAYQPVSLQLQYDQLDRVFWRVSAFDRFGFQGLPSDPSMLTFPPALR